MKQAERRETTRTALLDAVLTLQRQRAGQSDQSSPEITISEICREANLTRPTFYQYFDSADAAIAEACSQQLIGYFGASDAPHGSEPEAMTRWLDLLHHDVLLRTALTEGGAATRRAAISAIASRLSQRWGVTETPDLEWRARFAAAGVLDMVSTWLREDQPSESGDRIIELAASLARAVMDA